jgi:hypothetical protein
VSDLEISITSRDQVLHLLDSGLGLMTRIDTLNLYELEQAGQFDESSDIQKSKEEHIRSLLGVFSQYLRRQKLFPILLELAILGDDTPFFLPYEERPQQTFQSYIATEEDVLDQNERRDFLQAWTTAIERAPGNPTRDDFIVSNTALYGCFLIVAKFPIRPESSWTSPLVESDHPAAREDTPVPDPCFMRFGKPLNTAHLSFDLDNAKQRITAYLGNTAGLLHYKNNAGLLRKLADAKVLMIPFPRPSIEPEYLRKIDNPIEFLDDWAPEHMPSAPKPGACLFAVYRPEITSKPAAEARAPEFAEFEFAFFAQHMLVLSALNEARLNLIRHNDALKTQSLEKFTHFVKPELRYIRSLYDEALKSAREGKVAATDKFERSAEKLVNNLLGIIDFAEAVATGNARNSQGFGFEALQHEVKRQVRDAGEEALESYRFNVGGDVEHFNLNYKTIQSEFPAAEHIKLYDDPVKYFPPQIDKHDFYTTLGQHALPIAIGELTRNALRYAPQHNKQKSASWTLFKADRVLYLATANECDDNIEKARNIAHFLSKEYRDSNAISHLRLCIAGAGIRGLPKRPLIFVRELDAHSERERIEMIWVLPIGLARLQDSA